MLILSTSPASGQNLTFDTHRLGLESTLSGHSFFGDPDGKKSGEGERLFAFVVRSKRYIRAAAKIVALIRGMRIKGKMAFHPYAEGGRPLMKKKYVYLLDTYSRVTF